MPRAELPKLIPSPKSKPFSLDTGAKKDIAKTLGFADLSAEVEGVIIAVIECYKATEKGSKSTTVANINLALCRLIEKKGRARHEAIMLLADDHSGVDYVTHSALQPLAKAALAGEAGAEEALLQAARDRYETFKNHARVETDIEPLRLFCGYLRKIFDYAASPAVRPDIKQEWRSRIRFAKEVFTAANIKPREFESHPHRLKKYLGTDVS